jgi:putative two-component system response regulator
MTEVEARTDETVLIVDDDRGSVIMLQRILQSAGYTNVVATTDPREAVDLYDQAGPDLVLLDLRMPHLNGQEVLRQLQPRLERDGFVPVLVISADVSVEAKQLALASGARDFLSKPFDATEALLRIRNLLETRSLYLAIQEQTTVLEERVRERSSELARAQMEILDRLALAAEFRDDDTRQHTQRVGEMSARIAKALGLPSTFVQLIRLAAPLHDLGKIAVPDHILLKLGRLSPEEFSVIKEHTVIGGNLLSGSRYPLLQMAEQIARTHHEHWDGTGYSTGAGGEAIPLVSRIVAVADVFDALTHERPYKPAWPKAAALQEILDQRGRAFDPQVVDALVRVMEEEARMVDATA